MMEWELSLLFIVAEELLGVAEEEVLRAVAAVQERCSQLHLFVASTLRTDVAECGISRKSSKQRI